VHTSRGTVRLSGDSEHFKKTGALALPLLACAEAGSEHRLASAYPTAGSGFTGPSRIVGNHGRLPAELPADGWTI